MSMIAVAAIGGGLKIASGIFGSSAAKRRARALARQLKKDILLLHVDSLLIAR